MKTIPLLAVFLVLAVAVTPAVAAEMEAAAGVVSAEFSQLQDGKESARVTLSATQLHDLSLWLEQHHAHWHPLAGDESSETLRLRLSLRHSDGGISSLTVIARHDGTHYLTLTGPGRWAYRSFGGLFKSRAALRSLSEPDFASLRELLGAK